jgi:hypothetical protein
MHGYLHFADIDKRKPKGDDGYDPLFKVRYALDTMMSGMQCHVLLNYAIELELDGKSEEKPGWIRQKDFVTYDRTRCFF